MKSEEKNLPEKFSDSMSVLSEEILPKELRQRVQAISEELDQLLFLDSTDELAADRDTLIRIARNEAFIPAPLHDIVILESSKHLGRRVKALGDGRRITWRESEKYGMPIHPLSKKDLRAWGISKTTSREELGNILKAQLAERSIEIPEFWMNEDSSYLAEAIVHNFTLNRTVFDCMVANLGFWTAIVLIGSTVVLLSLLSEVGWQVALFWAIVFSGAATAAAWLSCVANPEFQA